MLLEGCCYYGVECGVPYLPSNSCHHISPVVRVDLI